MGARLEIVHGYVEAEAPLGPSGRRLHGARIALDIASVGATENLMMAAALAKGRTTLVNAAREPEVEELGRVLNKMGAASTAPARRSSASRVWPSFMASSTR